MKSYLNREFAWEPQGHVTSLFAVSKQRWWLSCGFLVVLISLVKLMQHRMCMVRDAYNIYSSILSCIYILVILQPPDPGSIVKIKLRYESDPE